MKKYYFISFQETNNNQKKYLQNRVIDIHPLQWQQENLFVNHGLETVFYFVLVSWNEITKKEYDSHIEWVKDNI